MRLLLCEGCPLWPLTHDRRSVLHLAAQSGCLPMINLLLQHHDTASPLTPNRSNNKAGPRAEISLSQESGDAKARVETPAPPTRESRPHKGGNERVRQVVSGLESNSDSKLDSRVGGGEAPRRLDVNGVSRYGHSALTTAIAHGHVDVVRALLAHPEVKVHTATTYVTWPLCAAYLLRAGGGVMP